MKMDLQRTLCAVMHLPERYKFKSYSDAKQHCLDEQCCQEIKTNNKNILVFLVLKRFFKAADTNLNHLIIT